MERKKVHWFDEYGRYNSAEQIAKFITSIEFTEGQDNPNSHVWDTLNAYNLDGVAREVIEEGNNGIPYVILTGEHMVNEAWLCDSKEDAFHQYCERVAEANGIPKEAI